MLYTSLTKQALFTMLLISPLLGGASPVDHVKSTYDYVPSTILSAAGYSGKKDKSRYLKSLSTVQKKGLKTGSSLGKLMIKNIDKKSAAWKLAEKIKLQQAKRIKATMQHSTLDMSGMKSANTKARLYYFISFSMPRPLIKAYMLDAVWNGGTLVLRGVEKGMSLTQFIQKDLMPLVKYKGGHARIEINPNLYEMYGVDKVPTTLVTTENSVRSGCLMAISRVPGTKTPYQRCKLINPNHYWKIEGGVSSIWALNKLKTSGAPVDLFLKRMQGLNANATKKQKAFKGDWRTAPMPYSNTTISQVLSHYGKAQSENGVIGAVDLIKQLTAIKTRSGA